MTKPNHHIAQINIARMRAPIDHPTMADFVAQLDYINAIADESPASEGSASFASFGGFRQKRAMRRAFVSLKMSA